MVQGMSLREWLIIAGALVVLVILVDGFRRMRRARREAHEISLGMGAGDIQRTPIDEDFNPELPNGGARVVDPDKAKSRPKPEARPKTLKPTRKVIEATADVSDADHGFAEAQGQQADEDADMDPGVEMDSFSASRDHAETQESPEQTLEQFSASSMLHPFADEDADLDAQADTQVDREAINRKDSPAAKAGANRPTAQEVLVINVFARQPQQFKGADLVRLFEACGLEHGDLGIFHRHEKPDPLSPLQFSVANAVEPGAFDLASMGDMSTPGLSFFMSLPGPSDAMQAFDFMYETAQCVIRNLGGEMKDERGSVMTAQTTEHCRQRIREYERKRRFTRV